MTTIPSPIPRVLAAGCVAAALLLSGCSDQPAAANPAGGGAPPPPPVTVAAVELGLVQVFGEFAGRVRGAREVEVRAQVGGILEERLYVEGRRVAAGEPLFRIERAPYEIALRRAEAERADARANLNQAERELRRVTDLFKQKAASERDRDRAQSALELAQAQLAIREAGVAQARLNLDYTAVRAPVAGSTSLESVPEGSLVERGALLAVVTQVDPVHVLFALPHNDATAQQVMREATHGAGGLEATVVLADGRRLQQTGRVDFADATIDARTGTVTARAVFANPDAALAPGQFVRVRVPVQSLEQAARVPPEAVVQGPAGPALFVLGEGDVAQLRSVALGPVADGAQVVAAGLGHGERIIVNGHVMVRDGMRVAPHGAEGEGG